MKVALKDPSTRRCPTRTPTPAWTREVDSCNRSRLKPLGRSEFTAVIYVGRSKSKTHNNFQTFFFFTLNAAADALRAGAAVSREALCRTCTLLKWRRVNRRPGKSGVNQHRLPLKQTTAVFPHSQFLFRVQNRSGRK